MSTPTSYTSSILIVSLMLVVSCSPFRVFLMGGAMANNNSQVYQALAQAAITHTHTHSHIRQQHTGDGQCSQDWSTTPCPKIAVITSAAQTTQAGNNAYLIDQPDSLSYRSLFQLYDMSPKHISIHIDNYLTSRNMSNLQGLTNLQIIKKADIIFFNGGDQARHARAWLNDDGTYSEIFDILIKRAQRNQVILAGTSAGSMIMCSPIYGGGISYGHLYYSVKYGLARKNVTDGGVNGTGLADTRNGASSIQAQDNGGFMEGFNAVPFLTDTHFDNRGRLGRLIPAAIQLKKQLAVGVDENTAYFYDKNVGTVYGQNGVFFVNVSNVTITSKTYFSAANIMLSYLTSGDSYNHLTNTYTPFTNKKLITSPKYPSHLDSNRTFDSYEITKMITHLVDQKQSYNLGKSAIPSGYSSSAPVFTVQFLKGAQTQGYFCEEMGRYMAVNVEVRVGYQ